MDDETVIGRYRVRWLGEARERPWRRGQRKVTEYRYAVASPEFAPMEVWANNALNAVLIARKHQKGGAA